MNSVIGSSGFGLSVGILDRKQDPLGGPKKYEDHCGRDDEGKRNGKTKKNLFCF